jgi:hypothetical protein
MYSRVTLLEIDTLRVTVAEAVEAYREHVLPEVRELQGFEGVVVLATPDGKGMIASFWETEADAVASTGFATAVLQDFVTLFRSPPGREQYEVLLAEMPGVTVA